MSLPAADQVVRVAVEGQQWAQPWANIFHVKVSGGTPGTNLSSSAVAGVLGIVTSAYQAHLQTQSTNVSSVVQGVATDLTSNTGAQVTIPLSGNGSITGSGMPNNCATCISWLISRRYRGGRPRTYLPPPSINEAADTRHFSNTFATNVQGGASAFLAAVNAGVPATGLTMDLACVHYYSGRSRLTTPLVDLIIGAAVNTRIDSQRRRLGKL